MFAYCQNNPVCNADFTGTYSLRANPNTTYFEDILGGGGGGAIVLGSIAVGAAVIDSLTSLTDRLWNIISQSYARSITSKYKSPEEVHHLVAKAAWNAAPAAAILNEVLPDGVENPINKISIKTGLHRRLHTKLYYGITNSMVITAYFASTDPIQQQKNVVIVIGLLRGIVEYLNALAPY